MKRTMSLISALCISWCIVSGQYPMAEQDTAPIKDEVKFIEGLSWQEVKEKAKKENKFIFLDMVATWCAPCKQMDQKTYTNPDVIKFLNAHFISVKVQTDQTPKDPENVKRWYNDAKSLSEKYHVTSLPTYIFLFPDGAWAYKDGGYKLPTDFIAICQKAIAAKSAYVDPDNDFYRRAEAYKKGNKDTSNLIALRNKAMELHDNELFQLVTRDLWAHLRTLPEDKLYREDYLLFIAESPLKSSSPYFTLFHSDATKINTIVGRKGFSERIVNKVIMQEKVIPFWKTIGFTPHSVFTGMYLGEVISIATPDWQQLKQSIRDKFGEYYAKRNTLEAKVHWYIAKKDHVTGYSNYFDILDNYGMDTADNGSMLHPGAINDNSWFIFTNISNKKLLKRSANWMKKALTTEMDNYRSLDTYANLLHKIGDTQHAIQVEKKAIAIARAHPEWLYTKESAEEMEKLVKKMEQGLPTWPVKSSTKSQ